MQRDPPVNHLLHGKLTFTNKKRKSRNKLFKTGGVMVVPEGAEMMPRAGADYSILSTPAFSAISDHRKIKLHHAMKEPNEDRAHGAGRGHENYTPNSEHREHKISESKRTSKERQHEKGKSTLELPSSSFMRKSTEYWRYTEGKNMTKVAYKEPKISTREPRGGGQVDLQPVSKRASSTTESSDLSTKKLKSIKGCKERSSVTVSSHVSSTSTTTPSNYLEKKGMKETSHWIKVKHEIPVVMRRNNSDSNSEDEILSRSVAFQPTSSSSCSSSSLDSEFEPLQMQSQGPLHSMVEHLRSVHSDDYRNSETAMKAKATIQDSRLFRNSVSDDVEESYPHSQDAPSLIPKLNTKGLRMLEKKNSDSCKNEKVFKDDKAYTEELVDLHRRLMALRERNILQQIVNLIEKTGHFNITKTTFDFDLFSLDEPTVRELQSYLQTKGT